MRSRSKSTAPASLLESPPPLAKVTAKETLLTVDAGRTRRRLAIVVLLTLLPWPAVWQGMYRLDSLVWTFALYHGLCLLPAALWGRGLWARSLRPPTSVQ